MPEKRLSKEIESELKKILKDFSLKKEDSKSKKLSEKDLKEITEKLKEKVEAENNVDEATKRDEIEEESFESPREVIDQSDILEAWNQLSNIGRKNIQPIPVSQNLESALSEVPRARTESKEEEEFKYSEIYKQQDSKYERAESVPSDRIQRWSEPVRRNNLNDEQRFVTPNAGSEDDPGKKYMDTNYDSNTRVEFERISDPVNQLTPEREKEARKYEIK